MLCWELKMLCALKCISTRREGCALLWASRTSYSTTHTWHTSALLKPPQWGRSYLTVQSDSWGPGEVCDLDKTETCHRIRRENFVLCYSHQILLAEWISSMSMASQAPRLWQFGEFFLRNISSSVKPGSLNWVSPSWYVLIYFIHSGIICASPNSTST